MTRHEIPERGQPRVEPVKAVPSVVVRLTQRAGWALEDSGLILSSGSMREVEDGFELTLPQGAIHNKVEGSAIRLGSRLILTERVPSNPAGMLLANPIFLETSQVTGITLAGVDLDISQEES